MSNNHRSYAELSDEECEVALSKLFETVISDLANGSKDPLDTDAFAAVQIARQMPNRRLALRTDPVVVGWAWGIAAALADDAVFIPDDGSLVVRL